jgi:tetratricopeptide (TPR) repeat protein
LHRQALDLVATDTGVRDQHATAWSLSALADLDARSGNLAEAWRGHDAAIAETGAGTRLRARLLDQAGRTAFAAHDFDRSLIYRQRLVELLEEVGDRRALAHASSACGDALRRLERYAETIDLYQRVAELDRGLADHRGEARALCDLADAQAVQGELERGIENYRRAAQLAACHDDREGRLNALAGIAMVLAASDPVVAASCLFRALLLATAIGHVSGVDYALERLLALPDLDPDSLCAKAVAAQELAMSGSPAEAVEHLRSAVDLAAAARDDGAFWSALDNLAGAAQEVGDVALAVETFVDAEALTVVAGAADIEEPVLAHLGRLVGRRLGHTDAAISLLQRRHDRAVARGDAEARLRSLVGLAQLRIGTVDEDLARAQLEEALHLARARHDPVTEIDVLGLLGAIERRHDLTDPPDSLARAIFLAEQHHPEALPSLRRLCG